MATIKSSAENLTLNADGASKDIKFQANGVEKASISSAGAFTSTTIDATKLTGALPAISGAALTGVGVAGITSSADATAITIDSSENVGIGVVPKAWRSVQTALDFGTYGGIASHSSGYTELSHNYYDDGADKYKNTDEAARILMQNNGTIKVQQAVSGSANSAVSWNTNLLLEVDGRGLSQFTAKAWINYTGVSTTAIRDSHNVSSVTDSAAGRTVINFSNNMANGNYATVASHNAYHVYASWNNGADIMPWNPLVGSVSIVTTINSSYIDSAYVSAVIFGD